MRRPRFSQSTRSWVCIRGVRLTSELVYAPGDILPPGLLRLVQLRSWFNRGRIAPAGSDYANSVLAFNNVKEEARRIKPEVEVEGMDDARLDTGFTPDQWTNLQEDLRATLISAYKGRTATDGGSDTDEPQVQALGGGWYTITGSDGTVLAKVHGKTALEAAMTEFGLSTTNKEGA